MGIEFMAKKSIAKKDPIDRETYNRQRIRSGRRSIYIGFLLLLSLVFLSVRIFGSTAIGSLFTLLCLGLAAYNYIIIRDKYLKLRAQYILGFVVLSLFAYYGAFGIAYNDTVLVRSLAGALITATSISAVFAVSIYEKMKEITVKNKHELTKELKDISIRLATYPVLISVAAVFTSIFALVFSDANFIFTVFLINVTITFVLITLMMSVELLKEDLMRQLE
jgi:hypothetical protein